MIDGIRDVHKQIIKMNIIIIIIFAPNSGFETAVPEQQKEHALPL